MPNIVVLGSGMAGFGAAYRLHQMGLTPMMYDKNGYHGGHTTSVKSSGFIFDLGPHISFTKDERIQTLLADNVDQQYETVQINLNNYWQGYWPRHPVQLNLHGLPEDLVINVIKDFVEERGRPEPEINNYADWLLASFGKTFAETFPMQYTRKYHLTDASNMTTDWLGPRIYRPNLEEVIRGAISPSAPQSHYITHFRYPTNGGFMAYLRKFVPISNLKLNHEVTLINPKTRQITFKNGEVTDYDALVSSVPLPNLLAMIAGAPEDVVNAAQLLACSTCVLVNIGVNRSDLSSAHMSYFYDDDVCFTRLSFPHMLSANNVPDGCGSIQAEVYFSHKYKPFHGSPQDMIAPVIEDLRRCGILRDSDSIITKSAMVVPFANVIFDLDRTAALRTVHAYLDEIGIAYCGRYGDWGYMWTDESFKSGENAATKAVDRLKALSVELQGE